MELVIIDTSNYTEGGRCYREKCSREGVGVLGIEDCSFLEGCQGRPFGLRDVEQRSKASQGDPWGE